MTRDELVSVTAFSGGRDNDADPGDFVGVFEPPVSVLVCLVGSVLEEGNTARECSEDDPRAETVRVSLAVTVRGGDGFILIDDAPLTRFTSGCEDERASFSLSRLDGVVVPRLAGCGDSVLPITVDDSRSMERRGEGTRASCEPVDERDTDGLSWLFRRRFRSIHPSPSVSP